MQEPTQDRWQLVLVGAFLLAIVVGVLYANRTKSDGLSLSAIATEGRSGAPRMKRSNHGQTAPNKSSTSRHAASKQGSSIGGETSDSGADLESVCSLSGEDNPSRIQPGVSKELLEVVARLDQDAEGTIESLRGLSPNLLGDAYLVYLLNEAGRSTEATELLAQLRREFPASLCKLTFADPGANPPDSPVQVALRNIRLAIDVVGAHSGAPPIACSVFRKHPRESAVAFGVLWGTERDRKGHEVKNYCVAQLLSEASPAMSASVTRSISSLCDALTEIAPMPANGWSSSIRIATCDLLLDAVLAPRPVEERRRNSVLSTLAEQAATSPSLATKMAWYGTLVTRQAALLGAGICAASTTQHISIPQADCTEQARQAALEALASWLKIRQELSHKEKP